MKRLTVCLLVLALALMGATAVMAASLPQALNGVNLATAQPLTDVQAQQIRGASAIDKGLPPGLLNQYLNGGPGFNNLSYVEEMIENTPAEMHSRVFYWMDSAPYDIH
jgi:hypothetical protein